MLFEGFMEGLEFQFAFSRLEEIAFELSEGKGDFDEYTRVHQLVKLYLTCAAGKRRDLDWQWLYDEGKLCEKDFEWFPEQMKEHSLDVMEYTKDHREWMKQRKVRNAARGIDGWFHKATTLDMDGDVDEALSIVYDGIDSLADISAFKMMDSVLSHTPVSLMSDEFLIMLLSVTLPYKAKLPFRSKLFDKIQAKLGNEPGLLTGLE